MNWRAGLSRHQLSAKYSINKSIIYRLIKKFLQTGLTSPIHSGGRTWEHCRYEDSLIKRTIQNDPKASSSHIQNSLDKKLAKERLAEGRYRPDYSIDDREKTFHIVRK